MKFENMDKAGLMRLAEELQDKLDTSEANCRNLEQRLSRFEQDAAQRIKELEAEEAKGGERSRVKAFRAEINKLKAMVRE